jgi:hypothetical protein
MIAERTYRLGPDEVAAADGLLPAIERQFLAEPLRWFISSAVDGEFVVESIEYEGCAAEPGPPAGPYVSSGLDVVVSLVPTGIGCAIGGYAGDAAPASALLAASADLVVTNPNAVNASNFIMAKDNLLYTEGYYIDQFLSGRVNLYRPRANRVGVLIERAEPDTVDMVLNVVNTARAVYGVDVLDFVVTSAPVGTRCVRGPSGAYSGRVERPDILLSAAARLVERGADAIAVTTQVQDLNPADYQEHFVGRHPNPVGGAEAVVSHLIGRTFGVPAAHAPMVNFKAVPHGVVDARAAGEFASESGLACVLIGLRQAPQTRPRANGRIRQAIGLTDVVAVVAPASALGGVPVLQAVRRGIPVIAVRENTTILDVTGAALGFDVIEVGGYAEAAGVVLALRNGISIEALTRPLTTFGGLADAEIPTHFPVEVDSGAQLLVAE